jgi:hypothetical protein
VSDRGESLRDAELKVAQLVKEFLAFYRTCGASILFTRASFYPKPEESGSRHHVLLLYDPFDNYKSYLMFLGLQSGFFE